MCSFFLSDPLEAPLNVAVDLINSTAIKVVWAPINRETVRGRLQGYKVIYCAVQRQTEKCDLSKISLTVYVLSIL